MKRQNMLERRQIKIKNAGKNYEHAVQGIDMHWYD